jgi:hypothetical protein
MPAGTLQLGNRFLHGVGNRVANDPTVQSYSKPASGSVHQIVGALGNNLRQGFCPDK